MSTFHLFNQDTLSRSKKVSAFRGPTVIVFCHDTFQLVYIHNMYVNSSLCAYVLQIRTCQITV